MSKFCQIYFKVITRVVTCGKQAHRYSCVHSSSTKLSKLHGCYNATSNIWVTLHRLNKSETSHSLTRIFCSMGTGDSFSVVKAAGRWCYALTSVCAEVKNEWSCSCSPPICHHGMHREKFSFTKFSEWTRLVVNFWCQMQCLRIYTVNNP